MSRNRNRGPVRAERVFTPPQVLADAPDIRATAPPGEVLGGELAPTAERSNPTPPAAGPPAAPPPAPSGATGAPAAAAESRASDVHLADVLSAIRAEMTPVRVTAEPSPYDPRTAAGRDRSFFADVRAAAMGDPEARVRSRTFTDQLGAYIRAANETGDSGDIIPPAWGGQWTVEQVARMRPLVSAFASTSISDPRPIPIPVVEGTTPDELVGEATEGTNPVAGVINFGQAMMTPKGYSGSAVISRELLDSSPGLVDRIVSDTLRESYSRATEVAMWAAVNAGGNPSTIPGGADAEALEQALRQVIALMPGTRYSPAGGVITSTHLYSALAGATATDGRPLFPYLGYSPTNAGGAAAAAFSEMSVAGVPMVSSWGLPSGIAVVRAQPSDAMSFESSLLSFTFQEKQGPALVEFAVFGYFGAVVRYAEGVVKVTSTLAGAMGTEANGGTGNGGNGGHKAAAAK